MQHTAAQAVTGRNGRVSAFAQARRERSHLERVIRLAGHLPPEDRALLMVVYGNAMTVSDVALLSGRSRCTVRRRAAALFQRVLDPRFGRLVQGGRRLPPLRRQIAEEIVLRGASRRAVARALGLTHHQVRLHLELALATLASAEAASSHHAAAHRSPGARQSSVSTSEKADA